MWRMSDFEAIGFVTLTAVMVALGCWVAEAFS